MNNDSSSKDEDPIVIRRRRNCLASNGTLSKLIPNSNNDNKPNEDAERGTDDEVDAPLPLVYESTDSSKDTEDGQPRIVKRRVRSLIMRIKKTRTLSSHSGSEADAERETDDERFMIVKPKGNDIASGGTHNKPSTRSSNKRKTGTKDDYKLIDEAKDSVPHNNMGISSSSDGELDDEDLVVSHKKRDAFGHHSALDEISTHTNSNKGIRDSDENEVVETTKEGSTSCNTPVETTTSSINERQPGTSSALTNPRRRSNAISQDSPSFQPSTRTSTSNDREIEVDDNDDDDIAIRIAQGEVTYLRGGDLSDLSSSQSSSLSPRAQRLSPLPQHQEAPVSSPDGSCIPPLADINLSTATGNDEETKEDNDDEHMSVDKAKTGSNPLTSPVKTSINHSDDEAMEEAMLQSIEEPKFPHPYIAVPSRASENAAYYGKRILSEEADELTDLINRGETTFQKRKRAQFAQSASKPARNQPEANTSTPRQPVDTNTAIETPKFTTNHFRKTADANPLTTEPSPKDYSSVHPSSLRLSESVLSSSGISDVPNLKSSLRKEVIFETKASSPISRSASTRQGKRKWAASFANKSISEASGILAEDDAKKGPNVTTGPTESFPEASPPRTKRKRSLENDVVSGMLKQRTPLAKRKYEENVARQKEKEGRREKKLDKKELEE